MATNFEGVLLAGRYEVVQHIATGGMSVVYRAWDHRLRRPVAVKMLRDSDQLAVTHIARFRREARTAALLHSPFAVESYDFFEEQGHYFLVMELVEGTHLKNYIIARGRMAVPDALLIAEQVCEALAVAHEHGFLHRDIKPQNILLDPSGNAKLADFGIVHVAAARSLTTDGIVLGTADYISPEQVQGLELGPTTDIYSLGVVLFEMLAGVLPFTGTTPLAVAMQHATLPPPSLRALAPETPRSVERLIRRALAKKPEQRFLSAREMGLALRQAREAAQADLDHTRRRSSETRTRADDWRTLAARLQPGAGPAYAISSGGALRRTGSPAPDTSGNTPRAGRRRSGMRAAGEIDSHGSAVALARRQSAESRVLPLLLLFGLVVILLMCIVFFHILG